MFAAEVAINFRKFTKRESLLLDRADEVLEQEILDVGVVRARRVRTGSFLSAGRRIRYMACVRHGGDEIRTPWSQ